MGLKGKIFKFMSDTLKDGSYYKLYTQVKSTSACGLPKGFFKTKDATLRNVEGRQEEANGLFCSFITCKKWEHTGFTFSNFSNLTFHLSGIIGPQVKFS